MSFQEKRSLYNLVWSTVVNVVFFIVINSMYQNGRFNTSNMMKFWSLIIIILIVVSVVSKIIGAILFRIIGEIGDEIKGEKLDDRDIVDERDKLIELKSDRAANLFFVFAFIIGCILQLLDYSLSSFFISLLIGGFIGEIGSHSLQIYYYRRGV